MPEIGQNLSDKFQAILDALTGLSAVQADLLIAQTATNAKLDEMISLLGANPFPIVDAINSQAAALLTALQALGSGQIDQAAITAAIDQSGQLGNIFSGIQGLGGGTDLAALLTAISAMRGPSQRTLTDLFNKPTAELSGDVTIDLTTTNERLLWIRDGLLDLRGYTGERLTLVEIRDAIQALAGPYPGATLTDVRNAIFGMQGPVGNQATLADLLEPWDAGQGITAYNLLDALRSEAITRNNLLEQIEAEWDSGAGITPYNLLDALRSTSITIQECICNLALGPSGPPQTGEDACSGTTLTSNGMIPDTISSELRNTVTFPNNLPPQLQFTIDYVIETASGYTWDGISVWVTSSANTFTATDPLYTPHPTNEWVDLSSYGTSPLKFSVPDGETIEVTLCASTINDPTPGDCINLTSQIVQYSTSASQYQQSIVWPAGMPASAQQPDSTRYVLGGEPVYLDTTNYLNWRVRLNVDAPTNVKMIGCDDTTVSPGEQVTIIGSFLWIYVPDIREYSIELCPPAQ